MGEPALTLSADAIRAAIPKLLVANRGEIACRIFRSARRLGIATVAVHSQADRGAPFVRMADEAVEIGPAPARESYLVAEKVIAAAKATGARAIHPGYGFLSERPDFARACAQAGLIFVGPPASAIEAMGLKDAAKALVEKAGVPVVPGYHGARQEPDFLALEAERIGYPVLIKAVAGGGGKGMKLVEAAGEFAAALASAQREAASAFGDPRVLVERYISSPRHIEIQVFADGHGHVVHLFERDCSLQRRHQKVIEEAPAPGMPEAVRAAMGRAAVEAARAVGYVGAGTVEFIADGSAGLRPNGFYFMEMNTRLQVEHPVTEAITGLDLVELQLLVAAGGRLPFAQEDLRIDGHAVEARLYAEDPERGFLPSTGRLHALVLPEGEGIRVDSGVEVGGEVTPFYDPMIAKIIAHGSTREVALDRLAGALGRTQVAGPRSNAAFLKALCEAPGFRAGAFDTGFIGRNLDALGAVVRPVPEELAGAGAQALAARESDALRRRLLAEPGRRADMAWLVEDGFSLLPVSQPPRRVVVDGEIRDVAPVAEAGASVVADPDAARVFVLAQGRQIVVEAHDPFAVDLDHLDAGGLVKAPMHGKLVALFVAPGDVVEKGQRLAIVEAMKMEHALLAPIAGRVGDIAGEVGQQVGEGARLILIEAVAAA
jgi:3-methylcrotonyl-CoA carboxylase alpha subunit